MVVVVVVVAVAVVVVVVVVVVVDVVVAGAVYFGMQNFLSLKIILDVCINFIPRRVGNRN
jgi:hypothetical protein